MTYLVQQLLDETEKLLAEIIVLLAGWECDILAKLNELAKNGIHDRIDRLDICPGKVDRQDGAIGLAESRCRRQGVCADLGRLIDAHSIPRVRQSIVGDVANLGSNIIVVVVDDMVGTQTFDVVKVALRASGDDGVPRPIDTLVPALELWSLVIGSYSFAN